MKIRFLSLVFILSFGVTTSCSFFTNEAPVLQFKGGILVLQSGVAAERASLTFLQQDSAGSILNIFRNLYLMQNRSNLPVGAYSVQMHEGRGYVVYPNSIFQIDGTHFTYAGIINDPKFENCRQFYGINAGKAYVTCWGNAGNSTVAVLDLNSSRVVKSISVGKEPGAILLDGTYAYVANSGHQTITVIDTQTDEPVSTLAVEPHPVGMAIDRERRLWVLCNGNSGSLVSIDLKDPTKKALIFLMDRLTPAPQFKNLGVNRNRDVLYFSMTVTDATQPGGLFQFAVTDQVKNIPLNRPVDRHAIDRMIIDPRTQVLYASTPTESRSKGYVLRYKLPPGVATATIAVTDSIPTDSIPPISPVVGFALQP
jgi:YVTN family beta-propeller protein